MTDLSDAEAIEWDRGNPVRRCIAHKKNGDRCRRWAIRGGTVCTHHGGRAPAVKNKARQRLEEAADILAKELLGIAAGAESESVRLSAIRDALDRAGVSAKQALEVSSRQSEPWQIVLAHAAFEGIANITREESRARRGLPNDADEEYVVDAELVAESDDYDGPEKADNSPVGELMGPLPIGPGADDSSTATGRRGAASVTVTYEDAPAVMRASRQRTNPIRQRRRAR